MVSTEALLWRLCRVGMINKETVESFIQNQELREAGQKCSQRGSQGRTIAAGPYGHPGLQSLSQRRISVGKLAEYLETTVGQLKSVLRSYGIDPFAVYYETMLGNS